MPYESSEFESDMDELLSALFPYGVLSGLRLFSPTNRVIGGRLSAAAVESESGEDIIDVSTLSDWGFEIDHLLHFRVHGDDFIVVIEAKNQPISVEQGQWLAAYGTETKCAKEQVINHIKALSEYLEPVARPIRLKFIGIVCSSETVIPSNSKGKMDAQMFLASVSDLPRLLEDVLISDGESDAFEIFHVRESSLLNLLRMSLPLPELGHPEIASAIRYVERCRRAVDDALFQHFEPTLERWVINGSAGMGKSVLLAYTAAVICSRHSVSRFNGEEFIHVEKKLDRLNLKLDGPDMTVVVMAMSGKQLSNLMHWFNLFVERFRGLDKHGQMRVQQPEFVLCRDRTTITEACQRAAALLVDEAHDLEEYASKIIVETHLSRGCYLVVACDRHQKLRLSKDDTKIIKGLDFSLKGKRLKQIYRNPIPIYIASLALMFRWGADSGPKVMPNWTELKDGFGFEVKKLAEQGHRLSMMSDAHPANSWAHSVVLFPSAESVYAALATEGLGSREVLWVRFSEEDYDFDYEKLSQFTYHNCRTAEAQELCDKYVKGQEFPVVVIEGFPSFVEKFDSEQAEGKAWAFRREIYLCASRATCFLYFVCNPRSFTEENQRFRQELKKVVDSVSKPEEQGNGGTRRWSLFVRHTSNLRKLDVFDDARLDEEASEEADGHLVSLQVLGGSKESTPEINAVIGVVETEELSLPDAVAKSEPSSIETEVREGRRESPWIYSELTPEQLSKLPSLPKFTHSLSIARSISVMDLARRLGVHHREIIQDGARLRMSLRGGTVIGPELAQRIAAFHNFGISFEQNTEQPPSAGEG